MVKNIQLLKDSKKISAKKNEQLGSNPDMFKIVSQLTHFQNVDEDVQNQNPPQELEVSIDQYEQIIDEQEIQAENEAREYEIENQQYFKFEEECPELIRIKDIINNNLTLIPVKNRPISCPARINTFRPIKKDLENIEIPLKLTSDIGIQVRSLIKNPTSLRVQNFVARARPKSTTSLKSMTKITTNVETPIIKDQAVED